MRAWLLYIAIVVLALVALIVVAHSFPGASPTAFYVGTPILVIGAGVGAKFVKERRRVRRIHRG
ncbi:hypothetical protein ACPEEZ_00630 [Frigoribacterium sp. 2-23]|uniref:hypothetical protein n=1 Tax=Frigoribacterium sp. 2-23 TaxID=3415006 RepID=UPI003C70589C